MGGIGVFELGHIAATLLILRATDLLESAHGHETAVKIALLLYTLYNLAARSPASRPDGSRTATDRSGC